MHYQNLQEFTMPDGFRGRSSVIVIIWWAVQSTLFAWSPQPFFGWRNFLLRLFGAKIGRGVKIRPTTRITYPWKLKIGDHCWVGDYCQLYNLDRIELGNHVALAHKVYLCTGSHDKEDRRFQIQSRPVYIEDEVWLTNDVFVGPGVTVGKGVVVGARSTVLKDLPEGMICFGYPAKPVKKRKMTSKNE